MRVFVLKRRYLAVLACVLAAAGMFWAVNRPAVVGASASSRQLPIYCVQRDQKMASLSFDAAWGDVIIRPLRPNALRGRSGRISCQNRI